MRLCQTLRRRVLGIVGRIRLPCHRLDSTRPSQLSSTAVNREMARQRPAFRYNTPRTSCGVVMELLEFDDERLRELVEETAPPRRAAFAAACAERLMVPFMSGAPATGSSPPTELRGNLSRLWRDLAGDPMSASEIGARVKACMRLITDQPNRPEAATAEDAGVAVTHAIRCRANAESHEAVSAARSAYEELAHVVATRESINVDAPGWELDAARYPIVQAELQRQFDDLRELTGATPAALAEVISRLRARAHRDSQALFDAISAWEDATSDADDGDPPGADVSSRGSEPLLAPGHGGGDTFGRSSRQSALARAVPAGIPSLPRRDADRRMVVSKEHVMAIAQTASTPNKADFIRAQPPGTSDADVVTNAKREGLVLDERYVRKVRNKARASGSAPSTSAQQDSPDSSGAPLTKADFIRARPGMSAANIVAAAKKAGITMSAQLVHNLRARERATAPKRKRGRPPRRTSAEAGKTAASKPAQVRKPRPVAKVVAMVEGSHAETPATGADDVARAPTRSVAITHARSAVASVASRGVPTTMPSSENMLRAAIAEVGLERAFVILEQERERVRALMGR